MLKRSGQARDDTPGRASLVTRGWFRKLYLHLLVVRLMVLACLLLASGAGWLVWKLSKGPVSLDWLASRIERRVNTASGRQLSIDHLTLSWLGRARGHGAPWEVTLDGVRMVTATTTVARLDHAHVHFSLMRLLVGEWIPAVVETQGLHVKLARLADGQVVLDDGDDSRFSTTASSTTLSSTTRSTPKSVTTHHPFVTLGWRYWLRPIQHAHLDATLAVRDVASGDVWHVPALVLDADRQSDGALSARLQMQAGLTENADPSGSLILQADAHVDPAGAGHLHMQLPAFNPAAIGKTALAGSLSARLQDLDAAVSLNADMDFDAALHLKQAVLQGGIEAGIIRLQGQEIQLRRAILQADADSHQVKLKTLQVQLAVPNGGESTFVLTGQGQRRGQGIVATAELKADKLAFADLPVLWPNTPEDGARRWVVSNIPSGMAQGIDIHLQFDADSLQTPVHLTSASGHMEGQDLIVHWLRPVPPVEHGHALLTIESPDAISIAISAGQQGRLKLHDGTVRIVGLAARDQFAEVALGIQGDAAEVVGLLSQPRLHVLSDHPVPLHDPSGHVETSLQLNVPLQGDVTVEQLHLRAHVTLSDLHLSRVALDRDLGEAAAEMDVTSDGLTLKGTGELAGVPSQLGLQVDFRDGLPAQTIVHATLQGAASGPQMDAADFHVPGLRNGKVGVAVDYNQKRNRDALVKLDADLTQAGFEIDELGWVKPPGVIGQACAQFSLHGGDLVAIHHLHAQAPALLIEGDAADVHGQAPVLDLSHIEVSGSRASGSVVFPSGRGDALQVRLRGPILDLKGPLGEVKDEQTGYVPNPQHTHSRPFDLAGTFDTVDLPEGHVLQALNFSIHNNGDMITHGDLTTGGIEHVQLHLLAEQQARHLTGSSEDAGALLHAFGVLPQLKDGRIKLDARFDDTKADHPLRGFAELLDFRLQVPSIVKLAQAMTLYGLPAAATENEVTFTRLAAPFEWRNRRAELHDARLYNQTFGATAEGVIDIGKGVADLSGTMVPAYLFNTLPGKMPLIGHLFSPEKGGGLFAISYTMTGDLKNPQVSTNPLSALAPGVLRKIFGD